MSVMYNVTELFRHLQKDMESNRDQYVVAQQAIVRELHNQQMVSFFLAIEPANDKRMIIIPLNKPGVTDMKRFPACQGTKVLQERLNKVGSLAHQNCLIIRQTSSETSIFESFAANLCERLWHCHDSEMLPMVKQSLEKWQNFFRKVGEEGLSAEQRRGLYGELFVLRILLENGYDADVVTFWQGPLREDLDFLFGSIGLEVKTTLSHNPLKVTIANEAQLSGKTVAQLFLAVLPLQVSRHDGETLCEIVASLRKRIEDWPISRQAFEDLLIHYGYLDTHAETYRTDRYRVLERKYFCVEGDFPRIDPGMLLPGVVHVQYQIILDAYGSFQREEDVVVRAIRGAVAYGS